MPDLPEVTEEMLDEVLRSAASLLARGSYATRTPNGHIPGLAPSRDPRKSKALALEVRRLRERVRELEEQAKVGSTFNAATRAVLGDDW